MLRCFVIPQPLLLFPILVSLDSRLRGNDTPTVMRDYQLVSPSLDGVLSSSTLAYDNIQRPIEVLRVLDGPAAKGNSREHTEHEQKVLQEYFQDLYGIFMKKFSHFMVEPEVQPADSIKLQAMLQEMIKIKKLMQNGATKIES